MAPRLPEEGQAREIVRSTRLSPELDKQMARRRAERGNQSVTTYLRSLVREDVEKNPERRRGR